MNMETCLAEQLLQPNTRQLCLFCVWRNTFQQLHHIVMTVWTAAAVSSSTHLTCCSHIVLLANVLG